MTYLGEERWTIKQGCHIHNYIQNNIHYKLKNILK